MFCALKGSTYDKLKLHLIILRDLAQRFVTRAGANPPESLRLPRSSLGIILRDSSMALCVQHRYFLGGLVLQGLYLKFDQ